MKTLLLSTLLCLGSLSLYGADYRLTTVAGGNWDTRNWQLEPGTGPGGAFPGANSSMTDSILDISGGTMTIFLNGDRTVMNLGKTGGNNTRFQNTEGQSDTLTVTGDMNVDTGTFLLRSSTSEQYPDTRLTVDIKGNLYLGSTAPQANTHNGRLTLGETDAYRNVTLKVGGTTTIQGYAGGISLASSATPANTQVHLGRLIFDLPTLESGNPAVGVTLAAGTLISVASIETTANDTRGTFIGPTTPESGPPPETARIRIDGGNGAFVYGGRFSYHLAIEKTGDNVQVFSRANGNSYSEGTVVTRGVLAITNTSGSGLGTGAAEISGEGVLAGSGRVRLGEGNTVTVKAGGVIAPGEADRRMNPEIQSFQQLTLDGLNQTAQAPAILEMEEGASFLFRVDENGGSDSLRFLNYQTGGLLLAAGGIRIDISGELAENTTYTLMTFSADSGLEEGLVMGSGFDGYMATFHYDDPRAITMTIAAIPEPSTVGLLLISALGSWCFHRRTRRGLAG
ncbi:MAG TPA: PEP-CTERM sorting domain-containing protein [Chthoniobacteraceae bacterium]|nr:PEP-CTERM sorting domain-containing protein [Chthoniobacteraceae bacterium]